MKAPVSRSTLRVVAAVAASVVILAACGGKGPASDNRDSTGSTDGEAVTSLVATGDQAAVEAAADSYPEPEGTPYDYLSLRHVEWLAFCGEAFGFETTLVNEPGQPPTLFASATGAQLERWVEVQELCTREAEDRGWVQPIATTEAELRVQYERLLAVNDCLTELGYGTDPMSWDTYMETREWNVYANTPRGSTLLVAPVAGTDLPADVRLQLSIQETCPLWAPSG